MGNFWGVPLGHGSHERHGEVEEDRPFWKVHGLSIFMSLAVVVLLVGALVLVVFGESIGVRVAALAGLGSVFATLWSIVQWPVVALVVLFAFAMIYYFAPPPNRGSVGSAQAPFSPSSSGSSSPCFSPCMRASPVFQ